MSLTDKVAFCTLADLKADLNITGSGEDQTLQRRILAASALIEAHCSRAFRRETRTEKVAGQGWPTVALRLSPILTLTSVEIDGQAIDSNAYQVTDAERGLVFRRDGWEWTAGVAPLAAPAQVAGTEEPAFEFTYTGGYILPNDTVQTPAPFLPEPVIEACLLLAANLHSNRGRDGAVVAEQVGDASVQYAVDSIEERRAGVLPRNVVQLLKPYRRGLV
jgi:hypothetical protein